uniref:Tesmin/TSO1-like CXC domain-containing protein n=1 Tax=Lygus hesperus TaxID=30085 RepID=A0A0A9YC34_LYGHE
MFSTNFCAHLFTGMIPITTINDAAPDYLLKIIHCKCASGCTRGSCSCKKAGLHCSALCKNCAGTACENAPDTEDGIYEDIDAECDQQANLFDEMMAQEEEEQETNDTEDEPSAPKRAKNIK